jgi:hypothetical protein
MRHRLKSGNVFNWAFEREFWIRQDSQKSDSAKCNQAPEQLAYRSFTVSLLDYSALL